MKTPAGFEPKSESFTEYKGREHLAWVLPEDDERMYPEFFKTELDSLTDTVKHFVTDDR